MPDEGEGFTGGGNSSGASGQWRPGYHRMAVTDASRVYFQVNPNGSCNTKLWWILERNREAKEGKGETLQSPARRIQRPDPGDTGRALCLLRQRFGSGSSRHGNHLDVYRWDEEGEKDTCLTCGMENEKGETITDANVSGPVMVSDDFCTSTSNPARS